MNFKVKNKSLVLATTNLGKFKEFSRLLSDFPLDLLSPPNGWNCEETGVTFQENARIKASSMANFSGFWSLADDSGLMVDQLGGKPGVYSSRYAKSDQERVTKILKELGNKINRSAKFVAAICIASKEEILLEVHGVCEGYITFTPRGKFGFGYDPIFQPLGQELTFAEMNNETKNLFSHRGKALELLKPELSRILNLNSTSWSN